MIKTLILLLALRISCRALRSPVTDESVMDGKESKRTASEPEASFLEKKYKRGWSRRDWDSMLHMRPKNFSRLDPEAKYGAWGPVFCKEGSFAYSYQIYQDDSRSDPKGLTHVKLFCLDRNGTETYIESGIKIGEPTREWTCPYTKDRHDNQGQIENKKGWKLSGLDQFLVAVLGVWADKDEGMIQFFPVCDVPNPNYWYQAKEHGKTHLKDECEKSKLDRVPGTGYYWKNGNPTAKSSDITHPKDAFRGPRDYWQSSKGMPQWIQFEFIEPLIICKISWRPRIKSTDRREPTYCPKSFYIAGSNNTKSFKPLFVAKDIDVYKYCPPGENVTIQFPNDLIFKYYRVLITDVEDVRFGTESQDQKFAKISELKLFSVNDNEKPIRTTMYAHLPGYETGLKPYYERRLFKCPQGQGICGIDSKVRRRSGINQIKIFCCAFSNF